MLEIKDILSTSASLLEEASIESSWREARLIIAFVLNKSYEDIFFHPDQPISEHNADQVMALIARRCHGEPLAKIIGHKEFWGLNFKVTESTLDPRPDSETLIESVIKYYPNKSLPYKILDLGTGTGCLLISTLTEYPNAIGTGVDLSSDALAVAMANSLTLKVNNRCQFIKSNWCSELTDIFDIILANPPYISEDELLSKSTLYDPKSALFSGKTGLEDYQILATQIGKITNINSLIFIEIGATQALSVSDIFSCHGFEILEVAKDLGKRDRCLVVKKK